MYQDIINKFKDQKILVIGDVMLDEYLIGKVERISPEAPVPIVHVQEQKFVPGGAANVANNITALGGQSILIGIVGNDEGKKILEQELQKRNIQTALTTIADIPTIRKTRIVGGTQQLARVDYENTTHNANTQIITILEQNIKQADIIIISDYAKGTITQEVMQTIKQLCKIHQKKILVDPKPIHQELYHGVFLIKPNKKEAHALITNTEDPKEQAEILCEKYASNILITVGDKGMVLATPTNTITLPTQAKEVYDVSGAGDTVIATMALCLASGASLLESAEIANHAAGIVVGKLGTATLSTEELSTIFKTEETKLKTVDEIKKIIEELKKKNKKTVFTNGCYDIIHPGHITLLKKAKSFGDMLILGLNSDSSIRKLKGSKRPILNETERIEILSAIEAIDYIVLFSENTPCELIAALKPDIHVKGGDYNPDDYNTMPEAKIVQDYGGKIEIIKLVEGKSTTNIIQKIIDSQ